MPKLCPVCGHDKSDDTVRVLGWHEDRVKELEYKLDEIAKAFRVVTDVLPPAPG